MHGAAACRGGALSSWGAVEVGPVELLFSRLAGSSGQVEGEQGGEGYETSEDDVHLWACSLKSVRESTSIGTTKRPVPHDLQGWLPLAAWPSRLDPRPDSFRGPYCSARRFSD
jgi:hypothetical protein